MLLEGWIMGGLTTFMQNDVVWILRIFFAAILGGVIGTERSRRQKEAGIRTHVIVALGSALIMIVSKYGFSDLLVAGIDATRRALLPTSLPVSAFSVQG